MATRTISTKLALDGEAEYKAKLKNINAELSLHKSELEKVQAQYKTSANSMEALTAKQSALKGQLDALSQKHSEQAAMLEKAKKAQQEFAAQAEELRRKLDALQNSSSATAEEEAKLKDELAAAEANMQKAANSATFYQKQLNNTERDQAKLSAELEQTGQYLDEAANSADGCAKSIDQYGKEVKEAGKDSQEFGNTSKEAINQLAAALAAAGVAKAVEEIAAALKECVDTFASFESQMSTVEAISGASGTQMAALAEKAKYMGATTSFTATEAGQALEYMAMAGWKTDDMLGGLEGIMHLAAASGESLASTSDIVTDALTAFGLAASDSAHFADVLAAASSNANTNVGMMGETFKYAAPVAGALGYSIEDTALAIGLMANAGIKGTQSGSALRSILTRLSTDAGASSTQLGALGILTDKLGVAFYNADGNARELNQVLADSRAAWAGLSEEQQISYGKIIAGQEAMSGWLALMNAGEGDFQKLAAAINTCNGSAKEMSEIKLDNYAGQMTLLGSAADGLKLAVGEQLAPALTKLAEAGTDAFTWATEFVDDNPWIVGAVVGVAAALGALAVGVAALSTAPAIIGALSTALNLLMANPVIGVTAALAGLAAMVGTWAASLGDADAATQDFTASLQESKAAYQDLTTTMAKQQTSTRAVAASLKQLAEVEGKSALQKDLMAQKVDQLNELVPGLGLVYDKEKDALIGVTTAELDSLLARSEAQAKYEAQVDRLNELDNERAEVEARLTEARLALNKAQEEGTGNTWELQNTIDELNAALKENAAEYAGLKKASSAYGEQQAEADRRTRESTARIEELNVQLKELEEAYEKSLAAAHDSLTAQMGLFQEMDGTAKTSIDDLIGALKSQVEYMDTYAANIQKAIERGVDDGLIRQLSDGKEESARILDAIVKGGEEDIEALNAEFRKVQRGRTDFEHIMAEMEGDFSERMEAIRKDLESAIQEMDFEDAAYEIGANNIEGLIRGTISKAGALTAQYVKMGREALQAYQKEMDQHSPSKKFEKAGRYDVQGLINGAESERPKLAAAYEDLAKTALEKYTGGAVRSLDEAERAADDLKRRMRSYAGGQELAAAYEIAAQTARESMARHLPSTMEAPSTAGVLERQMQAITAATVNAISGITQGGNAGPTTINLVLEDGTKLASYLFDPLADYGSANGTPILNPVR